MAFVSVPEVSSKRIIYMTLEAVSFCHSHNVLPLYFFCLQFFTVCWYWVVFS